jgi:hypothetical protein
MDIPKFAERLGSQQGVPRFEDLRVRTLNINVES